MIISRILIEIFQGVKLFLNVFEDMADILIEFNYYIFNGIKNKVFKKKQAMDNFQRKEDEGRRKFAKLFQGAQDIKFTTDKYDKVDAYVTGFTGEVAVMEIKNRDIPSTKYAEEGYILEENKYKALMDKYLEEGYSPYYISFFNDDVWYIWDCRDVDNRKILLQYCTSSTAENYHRGEVEKRVFHLKPEDAKFSSKKKNKTNKI